MLLMEIMLGQASSLWFATDLLCQACIHLSSLRGRKTDPNEGGDVPKVITSWKNGSEKFVIGDELFS